MAQTMADIANKPSWVDLSSGDAAASRAFYGRLFGWNVEVNPDPLYGGYAIAKVGGKDAAGIGPKMNPNGPTAWNLYIGTDDIEALAKGVQAAGGTVVMAPMDVGEQGRMAVFGDPIGAFISAWQGTRMGGFETNAANSFGWAELTARGIGAALPFYEQVFGWALKPSGSPDQPYTEFEVDGHSIGGATEMPDMVPAGTPNYWLVYFNADDVDATHRAAIEAGGHEFVAPLDFPGGRMSILADPQGAAFGLLKVAEH